MAACIGRSLLRNWHKLLAAPGVTWQMAPSERRRRWQGLTKTLSKPSRIMSSNPCTGSIGGIGTWISNHRNACARSLALPPDKPGLIRAREADDERALHTLLEDRNIAELANNPDAVRLLWEVCRVPDFRKVMSDAHARLLSVLYRISGPAPNAFPRIGSQNQINHHDRLDGDIDTLTQRIAGVRTLNLYRLPG